MSSDSTQLPTSGSDAVSPTAPALAARAAGTRRPVLYRRLRVFAFDPVLGTQLDTLGINQVTLEIPWENDLQPGPRGEYLEVIDHDPGSNCFYDPVDLDRRDLLATDGLDPSEGNPQFHQQMVYAVAMSTIRHFERALGRKAMWAPLPLSEGDDQDDGYVGTLRVYPHALREANAYYSPAKKALLFGYFPASEQSAGRNLPGGVVFTCLSHDIVAHETTHALLAGIHQSFNEDSNPDVLAFHEAFADSVALFQHFTLSDVLKNQVASTRGDLERENLLGKLAQQFGEAIGERGALRDAIGSVNPATNQWEPIVPDPEGYQSTFEPHARGSILVAALFDAFQKLYRNRTADLVRIATNGTGLLPAGSLHPDMVNRLAREAAHVADQVIQIIIRALDYCPPVDITFGEYLRALITADADLVPNDDLGYRVAFVEAFRRRGIYPTDVRSLAPDSLIWNGPDEVQTTATDALFQKFANDPLLDLLERWDLSTTDRHTIYRYCEQVRRQIHVWLEQLIDQFGAEAVEAITGLALRNDAPRTLERDDTGRPRFEVHAVRPVRRVGPDGQLVQNLVVEITQQRAGYLDADEQTAADALDGPEPRSPDFLFRGGCTIVFNLETAAPLYFIRKGILSEPRLARQRNYHSSRSATSARIAYFGGQVLAEPFALLHGQADWELGSEC